MEGYIRAHNLHVIDIFKPDDWDRPGLRNSAFQPTSKVADGRRIFSEHLYSFAEVTADIFSDSHYGW
jgi:rhodanese-related sulfurtransferase